MSNDTAYWLSSVPSPADIAVPLDALFDALSHSYRRSMLALLQASSAVHVEDVVAHVAAAVRPRDGESPEDVRARVATAIHHVHLPKLAATDLVAYDRESGTVAATNATAAAEPFLEIVSEYEDA